MPFEECKNFAIELLWRWGEGQGGHAQTRSRSFPILSEIGDAPLILCFNLTGVYILAFLCCLSRRKGKRLALDSNQSVLLILSSPSAFYNLIIFHSLKLTFISSIVVLLIQHWTRSASWKSPCVQGILGNGAQIRCVNGFEFVLCPNRTHSFIALARSIVCWTFWLSFLERVPDFLWGGPRPVPALVPGQFEENTILHTGTRTIWVFWRVGNSSWGIEVKGSRIYSNSSIMKRTRR